MTAAPGRRWPGCSWSRGRSPPPRSRPRSSCPRPGVRRHLDALIADGEVEVREASRRGPPRPRPAGPAVPAHRRRPGPVRARLRRSGRVRAALPGRARRRGRGARLRPGPGARADRVRARRRSPRPTPPTSGPARWPGCSPPAATRRRPARPAAACSCASTTARWRTSRPSSRCSARPRRRPSPSCWAPTCSGWPPSRAATPRAPPTFRWTLPPPGGRHHHSTIAKGRQSV